jgi:hypothetical protein
MKTTSLAALTALLALLATSAFGGECCGNTAGYGGSAGDYGHGPIGYGQGGVAPLPTFAGDGLPGGYENRIGSPYHYTGGYPRAGYGGDVYTNHFDPGFHRNGQAGHYSFPYYSYRRPWYHPGPPVYNANTNLPW